MNLHPKRKRSRSGITLLLVVICLIFITAMMSSMLRQFNLARQQHKQVENREQATLLAESAIERAVFALQNDSGYDGEVWQVSAAEWGNKRAAQVTIEVSPAEESTVHVDVKATYPVEANLHSLVRKHVTVRIVNATSTDGTAEIKETEK